MLVRKPGLRLRRARKGRFIRQYFVISFIIICVGLITSGSLEVYFSHQENLEHLSVIQNEFAEATAFKIERFLQEQKRTLRAATRTSELVQVGLTSDYKWELRRLLVNAPSITLAVAFDMNGVPRADAGRLRPVFTSDDWDGLPHTLLDQVKEGRSYFGPVYFIEGTGPYMRIAVPIERIAGEIIGMLLAELDLKYIDEVMSQVRVGKKGYAYLVNRRGQLIGHPDLSRVLQKRNLAVMEQIKTAFNRLARPTSLKAFVARNMEGKPVFTSYALIPSLGWVVFVEQPIAEIYAPLYASMLRTGGAFIVALVVALLATLMIRRRVVVPLEALRQGVERAREGDLSARLDIRTGDEIEVLADEFNDMAAHLRNSYADLERKVAERTSELRIANINLAEASKHKSRFLANVNHELRTPLSSIIGYARLLRRESGDQISSLQRENLDDLLRNAERLLIMIDSLLDFAKIEAGKMEVQIVPVRVDELIHGVASAVEPILDKRMVRLVRDLPEKMVPLNTDRDKLRQIVINLLGNAVKFTERGEIRISACQVNGDFKLAVMDTGIGIDPADMTRIFEEFDRGTMSTDGQYHGTGLGLAIVKRLAELLGGTVVVESEVGKGSTFTVTLPAKHRESVAG